MQYRVAVVPGPSPTRIRRVAPDDTPPGTYRLLVGWYNADLRMSINSASDQQDNLLILPQTITVGER